VNDLDEILVTDIRGEIYARRVPLVCDALERDHAAFVADLLRLVPPDIAGEVVAELHRRSQGRGLARG
jgi:hypothetical protein